MKYASDNLNCIRPGWLRKPTIPFVSQAVSQLLTVGWPFSTGIAFLFSAFIPFRVKEVIFE